MEVSRDFMGGFLSMLSHQLAMFGVHTLYVGGNITLFICQVTTMSKCHVTLWMGSSHPKTPLS